jgi:hypothetical protein
LYSRKLVIEYAKQDSSADAVVAALPVAAEEPEKKRKKHSK